MFKKKKKKQRAAPSVFDAVKKKKKKTSRHIFPGYFGFSNEIELPGRLARVLMDNGQKKKNQIKNQQQPQIK